MNIYLAERNIVRYDENSAHIIVANNDNEVLEICKTESLEKEGVSEWENGKYTIEVQGVYKGFKTEPFILLTDFYEA